MSKNNYHVVFIDFLDIDNEHCEILGSYKDFQSSSDALLPCLIRRLGDDFHEVGHGYFGIDYSITIMLEEKLEEVGK